MAESLIPTDAPMTPGMVTLFNKQTKRYSTHFPVDVKEILTTAPGEYEMVQNGAAEAARMNVNPLNQIATDKNLLKTEVTGIEGMVTLSLTEDEHKAWEEFQKSQKGKEVPAQKQEAPKEEPKTDGPKDAEKPKAAPGAPGGDAKK